MLVPSTARRSGRRRFPLRRAAGAVAGLIVMVIALTVGPTPAFAISWAGGVDMQEACREQHGLGHRAYLGGSSAYDWYCIDPNYNVRRSIDVGAYCGWKYRGGAYADPQGQGAFDWGCYYP